MERTSDNHRVVDRRMVSVPCIILCAVIVLIVGLLPLLPRIFTILIRPFAIGSCVLFACDVRYPTTHASRTLYLFLAYVTIVFLFHKFTTNAVTDYISMVLFGLFFIVETNRIWSEDEIQLIIRITAAAGLFCSIVLLHDNGSLRAMAGDSVLRFFGHLKNRNTLAFSIVPSVLSSTLLLFNDKKRDVPMTGVFYLLSMLVSGYTVIATGARSASLAMLGGMVLIGVEFTNNSADARERLMHKLVGVLLGAIVIFAILKITEGTASERIFKDLDDLNGREELWQFSRELIRAKPIFGGGFDYWTDMGGANLGTHNTYYTVMVISGYTGAFFLTVFLGTVLVELISSNNLIPLAFALEFFIHTYSESGLDYYAYLPLILAYIIYNYNKFQKLLTLASSGG